jgi:hypothetical protein
MPRRPQTPIIPEKSDEELAIDELREVRKIVNDGRVADFTLSELLDENEFEQSVQNILMRAQRQVRDIQFTALLREHSLIDNFVPELPETEESENEDEEDEEE